MRFAVCGLRFAICECANHKSQITDCNHGWWLPLLYPLYLFPSPLPYDGIPIIRPPYEDLWQTRVQAGISWDRRGRRSAWDPPEMPHEGVDVWHLRRVSSTQAGLCGKGNSCASGPTFGTRLFLCAKNWVLRPSSSLNGYEVWRALYRVDACVLNLCWTRTRLSL